MTKPTKKLLEFWAKLPEDKRESAMLQYFNSGENYRQITNMISTMSKEEYEIFSKLLEKDGGK